MANDPYDVLGVPRTASAIEIHAAYRRLSAEFRPDGLRGDDASEARFREIEAAYEVLSDARRRTEYDQTGSIPPPTDFSPLPAVSGPRDSADRPDRPPPPAAYATDRSESAAEPAFFPVIAGLAFLYFGFVQSPIGVSGDVLYDLSVDVFRWMARIVGIGLLVVAAASFSRHPLGRVLDLVVSAVAAVGCLVVGAIWMMNGDMDGLLILLLAAVNGWSAKAAWEARARS